MWFTDAGVGDTGTGFAADKPEKKEGAIGDVKAGDNVAVLYAGDGDIAVAKWIMIDGTGKKK